MFRKLLLSLIPLTFAGCTSIDLNSVYANKKPEYPHAYESRIASAITPALKEFHTDVFYKVSEPHRLKYKVMSNLINSQVFDGYAVCYMVSAKDINGLFDKNKIFLFIMDGDKILHSTHEMKYNVVETSRIYDTCNKIQRAQNLK